MTAPRVAAVFKTAWFGRDCPEGVQRIGLGGLFRLWLSRPAAPIVWHARRNNEMIIGLVMRWLRWPLVLVFTSAAQRHQTMFTRWLIGRMDAVIAVSDASASYLLPKVRARAAVINHGVDCVVFHPPADRAAAWCEAKLPGRYGIGCFGRVRGQKGTDLFVDAMCALLPRYPDFTAVVIGEVTPDQRHFDERLRRQVKAAGLVDRIVFLGLRPIEELPKSHRRTTIYAFTSRVEGFGLTLLEAMASGNALVAARAGGAEIVVKDGETGLLVPPGDAAALTAALEQLMRDPARAAEMGARASARAAA